MILVVASLAAGCGGSHGTVAKTRLRVVVHGGHSRSSYTLTCAPAGGSAPQPAAACRAVGDFIRRSAHRRTARTCLCPLYANWISVTGVVDGRRLPGSIQVSFCAACGLAGKQAATDVRRAFSAFHLTPG
jgi:hypothetical protein